MAAYTLDLLAQLPEAYQAFSPLIDILPLDPGVFPAACLRLASLCGFPLISGSADDLPRTNAGRTTFVASGLGS